MQQRWYLFKDTTMVEEAKSGQPALISKGRHEVIFDDLVSKVGRKGGTECEVRDMVAQTTVRILREHLVELCQDGSVDPA